jgi:aminoglycoside N3'-acetyltransferase
MPKPVLAAVRRVRKAVAPLVRRLQPALGAGELARTLRTAGIAPGDTIVVHSALSTLGHVQGGAAGVIDGLEQAVTPAGTVLMPVYGRADDVLSVPPGTPAVDLRTMPSITGSVTEAFRKRPDVRRSSHPFSSVCAWGQRAEYVTSDHQTDPRICHASSPLGRLHELGGKIVGLGVSLGPVSFYHVLEDTWPGFPHAVYRPPATVTYVDAGGNTVTRDVRAYERAWSSRRIDHPAGEWIRQSITEHFERVGILHRFKVRNADCWWISARDFYDEMKWLAGHGITIYSAPSEWEQQAGSAAAPFPARKGTIT